MFADDEERLQPRNKCWTCNKWFVAEDKRVRDHDHVTGEYILSTHWSCNINLKLTKKVAVTFHNLRGSDSHSIMDIKNTQL